MDTAIFEVIQYFDYFDYAPSEEEIYTYLEVKTTKKSIQKRLKELSDSSKIYAARGIYSLPSRKDLIQLRKKRDAITHMKLAKVSGFFKIMQSMPFVFGIGISGSCSMNNAREKDDIDAFIISAPGGIWTSRLISILVAKMLGIHRGRGMQSVKDTICLNLFFDVHHLAVPSHKRNLFTAHEVAQMKPFYMKEGVYEAYLQKNMWIGKFFPNMSFPHENSDVKFHVDKLSLLPMYEPLCRFIQMSYMRNHRTTELISDKQLWFFPNDVKNKVEKKIVLKG